MSVLILALIHAVERSQKAAISQQQEDEKAGPPVHYRLTFGKATFNYGDSEVCPYLRIGHQWTQWGHKGYGYVHTKWLKQSPHFTGIVKDCVLDYTCDIKLPQNIPSIVIEAHHRKGLTRQFLARTIATLHPGVNNISLLQHNEHNTSDPYKRIKRLIAVELSVNVEIVDKHSEKEKKKKIGYLQKRKTTKCLKV